MTLVVGIDPGQSGGIAMLDSDGRVVETWPMPVLGKEVDSVEIHQLLTEMRPQVVLERAGLRGGQSGALTIGANYGRLLAAVEIAGCPLCLCTPVQWSKHFSIPSGLKGPQKKAQSFLAARNVWGQAFTDLGLTKSKDGQVEALLIARWFIDARLQAATSRPRAPRASA